MNKLGNLDTKVGRDALPLIQSMIPWSEKIYDMTPEQLEDYKSTYKEAYNNSQDKKEREVMNVFYIEYQYYQIRKSYDWVLDQYKLSGDKMAIRREILLQRLRGSNNSPISPEDLEYLISNMKKSTNDIILCNKWKLLLYEHGAGEYMGIKKDLNEDIPYLVGIDPAGGGGGDNFSVTIVNPYNLKIAAEFKSPYISGPRAMDMLIELVTVHIPKCVLIPERNSMGIYLIQMILESDIRSNLYWSETDKQIDEMTVEESDQSLKELNPDYKKYGTYLNAKVRKAMFELFFQYIAEAKDLINSEYLVDDICKLIRTSTGRIEADKGQHDDCLMSYLHAIYIYHNGDNLERFGITRIYNPLLSDSTVEDHPDLSDHRNAAYVNTLNSNHQSYEQEVFENARLEESKIRQLVNRFDFIEDGLYSKHKNSNTNPFDNTVNIESSFFDQLNNY